MTAPDRLCEFERDVLAALAGRNPETLMWGAAVGAALEFLKGRGLVGLRDGVYSVTEAGMRELDGQQ